MRAHERAFSIPAAIMSAQVSFIKKNRKVAGKSLLKVFFLTSSYCSKRLLIPTKVWRKTSLRRKMGISLRRLNIRVSQKIL
jgi:hypothetical protein